MTSDLKLAANRKNANKSTGPRTDEGKSRASRNALRHGLAAVNFPDDGHTEKMERLARAICRVHIDPLKYVEALIIAESEVLLARVRAARVAALENVEKERENERRRRSDGAIENQTAAPRPHQPVGYRTLENLKAMIHAFDNGDLRSISKALNRITAAARLDIKWLKARLAGKPINPSVMRAREAAMLADALSKAVAQSPSNEGLRSVLPELISLERYERRALSRRRRAIRKFDALRSKEHSSSLA
jgi:hypothetical protein